MAVFLTGAGCPPKSKLASDYAVGESVFLNVNGTAREFLVVNQGIPSDSSLYNSSCDGTWLLMKDLYEKRAWDATNNDYANSDIHAYLNGDFLALFDSGVQSIIKQVKVPYKKGTGSSSSAVASGSSGLSTKIFLLGGYEVGWTVDNNDCFPVDGAKLHYFEFGEGTSAMNKRIAYYNSTAYHWWLRSPSTYETLAPWKVSSSGMNLSGDRCTAKLGIRPALILPYDTKFDPDTNEVKL